MADNDDTEQVPKILTFEPLGYLANQSPSDDSTNEPRQLETYANELTANIIKDASQSASKNHGDNFDNTGVDDNTNELNFSLLQASKQNQSENTTVALDKSEYSATNGTHDENDFDDDDIQKKMNGVIQNIQSQSVNDTPRKSIASNHLHDDQINNTTESPRRSTSESALTNHNISTEPTLPLPNRQDESSSDADEMFGIKTAPINANSTNDDSIDPYRSEQDNRKNNQLDDNDDFFNTKVASIDDDQQPTNIIKSNNLDETTRFGTTPSSRVQSASSKRSIRLTPDEPSTSGDEKRTEMSPSKVPDDTGNDTDRDNQEVAIIARRPSRAISPLDRPRSPTPNDSLKVSTNNVPSSSIFPPEQTQSPTDIIKDDDDQQKQIIEPSTSRRQSINKNDQQQGSRPTSAIQTKFDDNSYEPTTSRASSSRTNQFIPTDDQSKLIRPGEQLQIPSDDLDNQRIDSPPPSSTIISGLLLANPLVGSSPVENEQNQSRPSSETNRKSPTSSMISNEKVIDGDILPSKSRRESTISQQQLNNTDQKVASRRESQIIEQTPHISSSRRTSTAQQQDDLDNNQEQKVTSRKESTASAQKPASRKESNASQQQPPSRRESTADEQKPASQKESNVSQQQPSSKRESTALEQKTHSRKESTASEQKPASRKESNASQQQPPSRRESTADEQKPASRKESNASQQQPPSKRESVVPEPQISSRRQSTADEPQVSSKRDSFVPEQQASSRRESNADEQKPTSRRESTALEQKPANRKESNASQQQPASRKESTASEHQVQSKRGSVVPEPQISSRRESTNEEQKVASRKGSTSFEREESSKRQSPAPEQQVSSRRESHVSNQQIPYHRQSSSDQVEQNSSSKPVSRKSSVAEQQQQQIPSRRESQQQVSTSRRTSTNRDNQPTSPRESSRRNSINKQEHLTVPINANKDSRHSSIHITDTNHQQNKEGSHSSYKEAPSSDADDAPIRTSAKQNQKRTSSIDKRQKSSSTADENDRRRSSFQRRSEQELKRNSNINTDETVVTPIIMDSLKVRQHNGKRSSVTDSSYDQTSLSKLPPVCSSFQQEKPRRSETLNKQQMPISNRSDIKHLSSSHATSPSEDDRPTHWMKKIPIPSIHLSDDENGSSREDQPRPQSPNVEQIAERNQPPSPPLITTSTAKKRSAPDVQKRKQQHRLSRRSTSADSLTNIQLVDDHSLDSTSDVNTDFDSHKRRHIKPKKKDVETNTDQIYDSRQQRSFFDEKEISPQRPLKATKPLSDHLHSTRRRTQNKEQILTTPDSIPDTDTTTVRRSVKQIKDSNQDKDPVHVNVTVVVKKFSGTTKDGTSHTTAEAFVEQKPQQYFEPVQRPPEILPPPPPTTTTENKEKLDESTDRPKSTDQSRIKSTQQSVLEHSDRHTQSDTEQIITDKQKKRRRPKRISRTCQTYECVFRRMERDQQQDLRTTSDTEKNIQTRKSQLRPRKKSPKKNLPIYLSPDSFHLEELLPKQYHQSRRNMSKSSAIARSLSPQGGKLLIIRPTLPFHHTDAVNVHRVCLQYAIDLAPNENLSSAPMTSNRNKLSVLKQPEQTNHIPMISASLSGVNIPTQKSNTKEKSASNKTDDYTHYRKNGGAV